jgi:AraC-like DNA-binding protein
MAARDVRSDVCLWSCFSEDLTVKPHALAQVRIDDESGSFAPCDAGPSILFPDFQAPSNDDRGLSIDQKIEMLKAVLSQARRAVSTDPLGAQNYVDRALRLLTDTKAPLDPSSISKPQSGGLAQWQARRATSIIEAQLGERLLITQLAAAVRLSPGHFSRAFKQSLGCSPHHYLMRRRIEGAKERMRTTRDPLAQIALSFGFSDQPHFTRCFKHHEGETPTAWCRRVGGSVGGRDAGPVGTASLAAIA